MLRSGNMTNESTISVQALKNFIIPNKLKYTDKSCIHFSLSKQCVIQKVISCITSEETKTFKTAISTRLNPLLFNHLAFKMALLNKKIFPRICWHFYQKRSIVYLYLLSERSGFCEEFCLLRIRSLVRNKCICTTVLHSSLSYTILTAGSSKVIYNRMIFMNPNCCMQKSNLVFCVLIKKTNSCLFTENNRVI